MTGALQQHSANPRRTSLPRSRRRGHDSVLDARASSLHNRCRRDLTNAHSQLLLDRQELAGMLFFLSSLLVRQFASPGSERASCRLPSSSFAFLLHRADSVAATEVGVSATCPCQSLADSSAIAGCRMIHEKRLPLAAIQKVLDVHPLVQRASTAQTDDARHWWQSQGTTWYWDLSARH